MSVPNGLDENYDSVFSTLIERMMYETINMEDTMALLKSHEFKL